MPLVDNGSTFDYLIIGAGMSGISAGIRLAMFGKNICILEKHNIAGGLNSYYRRGKRELDVGLHALTNFSAKGNRKGPLGKALSQLRIPYTSLNLSEQSYSRIQFNDFFVDFSNNFQTLQNEIKTKFPDQYSGLEQLVNEINFTNDSNLDSPYQSAKEKVSEFIKDPLLIEMIFCPLLIYGSSWENDMDFSQFATMFKSIFLQGMMRPKGGVRTLISLLLKKLEDVGGNIRFNSPVKSILTKNNSAQGVVLKSGEIIRAKGIFSSAGLPETLALIDDTRTNQGQNTFSNFAPIGKLGFTECIMYFKSRPKDWGINTTLNFFNQKNLYYYQRPETPFDPYSAVVCFPNNFSRDEFNEGIVRVTNLANYDLWKQMDRKNYLKEKEKVLTNSLNLIKKIAPQFDERPVYSDIFTPTTIEKYTGHLNGAVYGSPVKCRNGKSGINSLYICGTDQGFLGIIGSLLSGISMANLHGLTSDLISPVEQLERKATHAF